MKGSKILKLIFKINAFINQKKIAILHLVFVNILFQYINLSPEWH